MSNISVLMNLHHDLRMVIEQQWMSNKMQKTLLLCFLHFITHPSLFYQHLLSPF